MKRPIGVTILAILAGIAAVIAIIHTLQMLHILPITLGGTVKFFTFDILGAILWGAMAAIWIWLVRMLWNLNPQGWMFVAILAVLNLIMAFVSIIGETTFSEMLPAFLINGIILIYALLPGTKAAFGVPSNR